MLLYHRLSPCFDRFPTLPLRDIASWHRATGRLFSALLRASRHAAGRFFPGHEELNVTGRRVQTGLRALRAEQTKNLPPWPRCHCTAGARAESCHYTVSLSARDTTRRGGIRAARGDNNSPINAVITVITRVVVLTVIVVGVDVIRLIIVDKSLFMPTFENVCIYLFILMSNHYIPARVRARCSTL